MKNQEQPLQDNNPLRETAVAFCEKNVVGWEQLPDQEKAHYVKTVAKLMLEQKDVAKEMFKTQTN